MNDFFDFLTASEHQILNHYIKTLHFTRETCILKAGEKSKSYYVLIKGKLRVSNNTGHPEDEPILAYLSEGSTFGEMSFLDNKPRTANVYAETDVEILQLNADDIDVMMKTNPVLAAKIYKFIAKNLSNKLRNADSKLNPAPVPDLEIDEMVENGNHAMEIFKTWNEDKVNSLLLAFADLFENNSEQFSKKVVELTGIGNVPDKILKTRYFTHDFYKGLEEIIGHGEFFSDHDKKIHEIANPVGLVFGIIPVTNPISTLIFKIMICLKNRNAVIFSLPSSLNDFSLEITNMFQELLLSKDAPKHLIQIVIKGSREKTRLLMQHPGTAFILATGGPALVKAAYSSGKPAIGVGAGNTPVLIAQDADLFDAAKKVIQGRAFDNGVLCVAEQSLIIVNSIRDKLFYELIKQGVAILEPHELDAFTISVFEKHHLKQKFIGKSAQEIAEKTHIKRNYPIKVIAVPINRDAISGTNPYALEKLAPILTLFTVSDALTGIDTCEQLLNIKGKGHTAIIHSKDIDLIKEFSNRIEASRILINAPSTGVITGETNLIPSLTLGCGTFGGSSTTDNVGYMHLRNIKRIAWYIQSNL